MNCLYFINLTNETVSGSFVLDEPVGTPVTLPSILKYFPYAGEFAFR